MNVFKEEEEIYIGNDKQHSDDVLERNQVESELLKCLLNKHGFKSKNAVSDKEVSQVLVETKMHASFQVPDVLASTKGRMNEYVIVVRKTEYELLLESKVEV